MDHPFQRDSLGSLDLPDVFEADFTAFVSSLDHSRR